MGVLVAACESDDAPGAPIARSSPDAQVDTPDAQAGCDAGLRACGATCVDPASDPEHCGACGHACAANETCQGGQCSSVGCIVDGTSYPADAPNPANACERCLPATSKAAWSRLADGSSCGAGLICEAGTCSDKCLIDGTFHAAGTANPADRCQQCTPASSTTAWSPRDSSPLFVGGIDPIAQGWTVAQDGAEITQLAGATRISTTTAAGARTSGYALLHYSGAYEDETPFAIRVDLVVTAVSRHNQLDSGAAILGAFTPPAGSAAQRSQMVFLDPAAVGWADDSQSAPVDVLGVPHIYELSVDATKTMHFKVDGVEKLTRPNFVGNGTIAIGDQTNDPNVDGTIELRGVSRACP